MFAVSFILALCSSASSSDVVLPIPGRLQWDNRDGYCGSCSLQQSGLFFGNWISQDIVRKSIGDKELLPGVNEAKAARTLKFSVDTWNGGNIASKKQYQDFMVWVKTHLLQQHPVVIAFYLSECSDSDYDHIMPAIGIKTAHNDTTHYHGDDMLVINNNYKKEHIMHTFDKFQGSRHSCSRTEDTGGCIPEKVDYGVAVKGNIDQNDETFPLQLAVDRWDEPNVGKGKKSVDLAGTLSASGLTAGENYMLLRFTDAASVPKSDFARSQSSAEKVTRFTVESATWTYTDPLAIPSGGSTFYRLVRASSLVV